MCANVLGVLAGGDISSSEVARWASSADLRLAADGGASTLLSSGFEPHHIIGDFDSLHDFTGLDNSVIHRAPDQDSTDCDKLLNLAVQLGVVSMTLIGVEGDRLDHVLSTLHSMAASTLDVQAVLRMGLARPIRTGESIRWFMNTGRKLSLIPLAETVVNRLDGVRWPLADHVLRPAESWSISNETLGGPVTVSVQTGAAVLIAEFSPEELPRWTHE